MKESDLLIQYLIRLLLLFQTNRPFVKNFDFMYHLYILKCSDKTLYTGIAVNLPKRVKEHNSGKFGAKYTRGRRPVELVYSRNFRNRSTASKEEHRIKRLPRSEKLRLLGSD